MMQTQYFLGANAPGGFASLYQELLPPEKADALYILKGGAGCGKSTLMRRVAELARGSGLDTVLIPCSGDPDSLDGLILPQKRVAIVDGTAPHVVEPSYPGAVESYVNLGNCYDRAALRPLRQEIIAATGRYQSFYPKAYRCLSGAAALRREDRALLCTEETRRRLARRAESLIKKELKKSGGEAGEATHRFLSAVTHRGRVTLWDTVTVQAKRVYLFRDRYNLAHEVLSPILTAALAAGWDAVACPDPQAADRLAHVILPGLSLAFVSAPPGEKLPFEPARILRLKDAVNRDFYKAVRPRLRLSRSVAGALEQEAVDHLARAKAAHDQLEALYNPHVDFDQVNRIADALAEEIF